MAYQLLYQQEAFVTFTGYQMFTRFVSFAIDECRNAAVVELKELFPNHTVLTVNTAENVTEELVALDTLGVVASEESQQVDQTADRSQRFVSHNQKDDYVHRGKASVLQSMSLVLYSRFVVRRKKEQKVIDYFRYFPFDSHYEMHHAGFIQELRTGDNNVVVPMQLRLPSEQEQPEKHYATLLLLCKAFDGCASSDACVDTKPCFACHDIRFDEEQKKIFVVFRSVLARMPASGGTATAEFRGAVHSLLPAMDLRMDSSMDGHLWSGLICMDQNQTVGLAHGQSLVVPSMAAPFEDTKMMLYNWKVSWAMGQAQLTPESESRLVVLPDTDAIDVWQLAEVCTGIGGISAGLRPLGFTTQVGVEVNPYMCASLRTNGYPNVIEGDVMDLAVRYQFHVTPTVFRGTLCAGFPCQPLSAQGDQLGEADPRALPFKGVLRTMWEQQHGALVLECVPNAKTAPWIQTQLQQLAWSMGMHFEQRILSLDRSWPCRRTRWWLFMIPQAYQPQSMLDMPVDENMQCLEQLFPRWADWPQHETDELYVPAEDLAKYQDETYGNDIRRLQQQKPCPCILHSYSFALSACPCGCRAFPFSECRLQSAGLRGFYIIEETTGKARYLHVKEAALLCTFDPLWNFGTSCKDGLCLIGQVAAPLQALWVGTFLLESLDLWVLPREQHIHQFKWHLLRKATYAWPSIATPGALIYDTYWSSWLQLTLPSQSSIMEMLQAEHRLHQDAMILKFQDAWDTLPIKAYLATSMMTGPLVLTRTAKRQRLLRDTVELQHKVPVWQNDDLSLQTVCLPAGSFLFELFAAVGCMVQLDGITDIHQGTWRADDRLWRPIVIASYRNREVPVHQAAGRLIHGGITDTCLDATAQRILAMKQKAGAYWVPASLATDLMHQSTWQPQDGHPFLGALHGRVYSAVVIDHHWFLLELTVQGTTLVLTSWTGEDIVADGLLSNFADRLSRALAFQGFVLQQHFWITQTLSHTCGALAILHLGCRLKLWSIQQHPDEQALYLYMRAHYGHAGQLRAFGRATSSGEQDVVWQLRDLLKSKGVDDSRTEERALAAINKIGLAKLQDALHSAQPWMALKSLGSAPKVNFMWIKPDELERQIRARATAKFHIGKSNKKGLGPKPKMSHSSLDPELLELIPDTFMTEQGNPVLPISMDKVGSDRAGLAFGLVSQVLPFLKEGVSLSLDALGVLTTSPIPVESHGLLPVTAIRFPALYRPTQEPILVDGSLVQLGDITIARHREGVPVPLESIPTGTLKLSVYRDEWPGEWEDFIKTPMKLVTEHFPKLVLCKGLRCGGQCAKFHSPVDADMDGVILDLWSRSWQTHKGKRTTPQEADQFQVLIRVPKICVSLLQGLSGTSGFYAEPRRDDGGGPSEDSMVIWVPNGTLDDAILKSRTIERVLAICRFGHKYGIRVSQKDAEATHSKLNPDIPFQDFHIQLIYEVRPLPHGTQRAGVVQLLKKWHWKARPLQPHHSDQQGMGWLVGAAVEPPAMLFPAQQGDVTVVLHKKMSDMSTGPQVLTTMKTRSHMQQKMHKTSDAVSNGSSTIGPPPGLADPWANWKGPWARGKPVASPSDDVQMAAASRIDQLEARVSQNVQQQLLRANAAEDEHKHEERFQKLEVDISELKKQHTRYEGWFQDAASMTNNMQSQIGELRTQVREHSKELTTVRSEIQNGFQSMEALFSKKHRMA